MIILNIIGAVLIGFGSLFLLLGSLGLFRMPDVFNKLQAGTKATTLGFLSISVGAIFIKPGWWLRFLIIALFVLLTNPIGSHVLARASKNQKVDMVKGENKDDKLGEKA